MLIYQISDILYTENYKKSYQKTYFKISAPTVADSPPIRTYVNQIRKQDYI